MRPSADQIRNSCNSCLCLQVVSMEHMPSTPGEGHGQYGNQARAQDEPPSLQRNRSKEEDEKMKRKKNKKVERLEREKHRMRPELKALALQRKEANCNANLLQPRGKKGGENPKHAELKNLSTLTLALQLQAQAQARHSYWMTGNCKHRRMFNQ